MNVLKRELKGTPAFLVSMVSLSIIVIMIILSRKSGLLISMPFIDSGAGVGLVFGAGILPALIFFGLITEKLSGTITLKLLRLSGIILIVLGSMMLNKGILTAFSGNGEGTTMPACNCHKPVTGITASE